MPPSSEARDASQNYPSWAEHQSSNVLASGEGCRGRPRCPCCERIWTGRSGEGSTSDMTRRWCPRVHLSCISRSLSRHSDRAVRVHGNSSPLCQPQ